MEFKIGSYVVITHPKHYGTKAKILDMNPVEGWLYVKLPHGPQRIPIAMVVTYELANSSGWKALE